METRRSALREGVAREHLAAVNQIRDSSDSLGIARRVLVGSVLNLTLISR
jgi:hypothetical protein